MPATAADVVEEYRSYLARFEEQLGPCEFGAFAKLRGRLIKKLTYEEFEAKLEEFQEIDRAYTEIMSRGDTINDVIVRIHRERCDDLVMERKV